MRPHLSLLWTTGEGTSFKDSFPTLGFCPLQSRVGDPGVWSLWKCNWACIQRAWTAARPQRMLSVSTLKPLLWGGHRGVPTALPVPSSGAQGWHSLTEWGVRQGSFPAGGWHLSEPEGREMEEGGFFGAPQAMPAPTARECLCHLGAGRQQVWLLRQI